MKNRLTVRDSDGRVYYVDGEKLRDSLSMKVQHVGRTLRKLSDYEDAEEQGLLLRLPCKVGDTVWVYFNYANSEIQKAEAKEIELGNFTFGNVRYLVEHINRRGSLFKYYDRDFGESIFLTREAAEQVLKEIENKKMDFYSRGAL